MVRLQLLSIVQVCVHHERRVGCYYLLAVAVNKWFSLICSGPRNNNDHFVGRDEQAVVIGSKEAVVAKSVLGVLVVVVVVVLTAKGECNRCCSGEQGRKLPVAGRC